MSGPNGGAGLLRRRLTQHALSLSLLFYFSPSLSPPLTPGIQATPSRSVQSSSQSGGPWPPAAAAAAAASRQRRNKGNMHVRPPPVRTMRRKMMRKIARTHEFLGYCLRLSMLALELRPSHARRQAGRHQAGSTRQIEETSVQLQLDAQ